MATDVVGIIFPFLPEHVKRFMDEQKTVYVKFFGKQKSLPKRIMKGSKLFFYESHGRQEIVGEAEIAEVATEDESNVLLHYGERLFLTPKEYESYVGSRKGRALVAITVRNPRRYKGPKRLDKPLTMTGRYMTREMFKSLG